MSGTTVDSGRGVSQRAPSGRSVGMDVLANKFNEHLPPHETVYRFGHRARVFVEKPGTGIYADTLAELLLEFPQ